MLSETPTRPSGMMAKGGINMTTQTTAKAGQSTALGAFLLSAAIGLGIISVAGHVQAESLHDAAHDVRHATGFPCH